ncbi:T9SS type A sorting domain-containing protein [Pedobacter helvus]|uniref:T9SS type A sorting domain-containing protein n=1 Tax=Pedobacter helvus TaxID=2563444 RepID=A0ABW9JIY6_9SPHI|nr:T9SS type A sorting domain-containing protein [Pedobacter ureilyticus]
MKRKLLTLILTAFGAFGAFAQFTAGNLAVYRYGDGATPLANGTRVPVFVDEYTPSGTFVKTIAIPQTAASGNYGFEGLGLTGAGLFEAEGFPVLSRDGSTFSVIGYNPAQAGEFVIGTLNAAGNWSANTLVIDAIGAPRSAVVEGTSVYFNGYQNGVRYKTLGTATASTRVSTDQNAPRVLTIAATSFGAGPTVADKIFAPIGGNTLASTNLPLTTQTSFTTPLGFPSGTLRNLHQAIVFKSASGRTFLYLIDDNAVASGGTGVPLLRKFRSNSGGSSWVDFKSIELPLNTKSIAGVYTAGTGVKLYFTSYSNPNNAGFSELRSYQDDFVTSAEGDEPARYLTGNTSLIATAAANTTFRGVTMAPGTSVLPVKFTTFNANERNGAIRLNWATASETNSSHFDILRSTTATNFVKIDQVSGKGTTNAAANYSYLDEKPLPGTNYYKLKQVDFNGDSEEFGPVSATIPVAKTDFTIAKQDNNLEVQVYSAMAQSGKIEIIDVNGKINHSQSVQLEKGLNKISISAAKLPNGLNVIVLNTAEGKVAKKIIR